MRNGISVGLAAMLMACGVAATSNDAAESATQRTRPKAQPQRPVLDDMRFDRGGMAGCFDPNLSGSARTAAEAIGGVPCETPRRATTTPPAQRAGATAWIVGAWVTRGTPCGGEGLVIERDGTFVAESESGSWTLAGNTLTLVTRRTFDMGDVDSEQELKPPRTTQFSVTSSTARAFSMRQAGERVWNMVRCR
jgi:hypothetical protein